MLLGGLAGTLITMFHTENERDNIQNRKDQKQLSYIHKKKQTKLPVMYQSKKPKNCMHVTVVGLGLFCIE